VEQIILVVHLLIALSIIGLIMMQQGKGADIGASFGAGGSQTLFGSVGSANVLTRGTAWLAAAFFATSFGLAIIADSRTASDEDLGFELPVSAEVDSPSTEIPVESELPEGDIPNVSFDTLEDMPTIEAGDTVGEIPEG
jgi:preprotein translocase subunit SecG